MNFFSELKLTKDNYFNLLLALIPASFIAGNMIINVNIILLILSTIIMFGNKPFKIEFHFLDRLFFVYFFFILVTGLINDIQFYKADLNWKGHFATTFKSFFYLRFLILYLILRFLIEKRYLNLKLFFISCAICTLFVSFDLFYQLIFGKDIFGLIVTGRKLSGPFGDELIAGGYLQKFSIFTFFLLTIFFNFKNNKYNKVFYFILFIIFFSSIIISGNRMPLILFVFCIFLILLFEKKARKYLLAMIISSAFFLVLIFNFNSNVKNNFQNLYVQVSQLSILVVDKFNEGDPIQRPVPQYIKEFATFYQTWLSNKYIGGGIKNFRYYCHVRPKIDTKSKFYHKLTCNMHPHNYYLEILTDLGIIGFTILIIIIFNILYISLYKKYFTNSKIKNNNILIPFIFLFLVEIFPIKSTGSFFTTANATYIFLILSILIALIRKDNLIEKTS